MDDLISRQAAIEHAHFPMIDDAGYEVVRVDDILALPSAKSNTKCITQIKINRDDMEDLVNEKVNEIVNKISEPKTGHWIFNPKDAIELMFTLPKCSECGFESSDCGNFCSNCGARMNWGVEE